MSRTFLLSFVLFCSICTMMSACNAAANLANGKPYTVAPTQNYRLTAVPSDSTSLTDGLHTVGHFWTQSTTLGWEKTKSVEILIDLEKNLTIESIVFSSARGNDAGVYYPQHIAAFVGSDRDNFQYVGDLMANSNNKPGAYLTNKFKLNNVGARGRYILLEIIPKGFFIFCDEIEVFEGIADRNQAKNLTREQVAEFTQQLIDLDREKELLIKTVSGLDQTDGDVENEGLRQVKQQILDLSTLNNTYVTEKKILELRGTQLARILHSKPIDIQGISPWAPLVPVSRVFNAAPASLSLVMPKGGYDSGALLVTNLSTRSLSITVELSSSNNNANLIINHVPFVKAAAVENADMPLVMEYVADPLVPITSAIDLSPGESRMVFVTAVGKQTGSSTTALNIQSGAYHAVVPITVFVSSVELPNKLSLNSVNWGYLDFKLIRDRQQAAVADMLAHHTNVVVVPPAYLPEADPVAPLDFSRLEAYLKMQKGADRILLFMNLRTDDRLMLGGGYSFLGAKWKAAAKRWYEGCKQVAIRSGFMADQVYWYPFDEMADKEIDQFIELAKWARNDIDGVKFYATLGHKNSERALPYIDIAQIVDNDTALMRYAGSDAEKWLYTASGPAKSLSSYSHYRLMAWRAYLIGYKGIGFWSYADAGFGDNQGTAWDDFDGNNPDYSVIYDGINRSIISSRRWEGWRMGIEDYELLLMYARDRGDAATRMLVNAVLDNPTDTSRADEARKIILMNLSR